MRAAEIQNSRASPGRCLFSCAASAGRIRHSPRQRRAQSRPRAARVHESPETNRRRRINQLPAGKGIPERGPDARSPKDNGARHDTVNINNFSSAAPLIRDMRPSGAHALRSCWSHQFPMPKLAFSFTPFRLSCFVCLAVFRRDINIFL